MKTETCGPPREGGSYARPDDPPAERAGAETKETQTAPPRPQPRRGKAGE